MVADKIDQENDSLWQTLACLGLNLNTSPLMFLLAFPLKPVL